MKIVHILPYFSINYRYQEYYLMKEEVAEGHAVFLVTSTYAYPFPKSDSSMKEVYGDNQFIEGETLEEGIHVVRLKTLWTYRNRVWLKNFKSSIHEIHPDIVIAHNVFHIATLSLLIGKRPDYRLIFDDHMLIDHVPDTLYTKFAYFLFRKVFKNRLNKRAEKVVAIASGCYPVIEKMYGVRKDKIETIYLGVDSELYKFDHLLRDEFRSSLPISSDTVLVTYTGKMFETKDVHLIMEVLNEIECDSKVHVLLVGSVADSYRSTLKNAIDKCKYPCTLLPMQNSENLRKVYCATDIAVWPKSATISTLEASACECAIIVGTHITERCNYGNGIVINAGNFQELKGALKSLIINEELRKLMGKQGRIMVVEEHSWQRISQRFIS